jgi:hypothetical protein
VNKVPPSSACQNRGFFTTPVMAEQDKYQVLADPGIS